MRDYCQATGVRGRFYLRDDLHNAYGGRAYLESLL